MESPLYLSSAAWPRMSTMTTAALSRYTHDLTGSSETTASPPAIAQHHPSGWPCESHDATSNFGRNRITITEA